MLRKERSVCVEAGELELEGVIWLGGVESWFSVFKGVYSLERVFDVCGGFVV